MMDLRIDNCTHHLRLKLRVAIQVSTDIFYIKVFLIFFYFIFNGSYNHELFST